MITTFRSIGTYVNITTMPARNPSASGPPNATRTRTILRTARQLANEIGLFVAGKHRGSGQRMQSKGIGDFVTAIDLQAERRLRRRISAELPDHGILGEELPPHFPHDRRRPGVVMNGLCGSCIFVDFHFQKC